MSKSAEKVFTRALHLSDPWEMFSVNIDDAESERISISVRRVRWNTSVRIPDAHAKITINVKVPGNIWISFTWNVISILQTHICNVRNV